MSKLTRPDFRSKPTRDGAWIWPALLLTVCMAAFVLLAIPDRSGIIPAFGLFPLWMLASGAMAGVYGISAIFNMMRAGVDQPIGFIRDRFAREHIRILLIIGCVALAGVNMITFMWLKPLLNYAVPFKYDLLLARIDNVLFLGKDPWRYLTWLNSDAMAVIYHRGWFALMVTVLLITLSAPASREKSAVMITYFLLWSVVGPLIHLAVPAAGPIFYENLGLGDRFTALPTPPLTADVAEYLWQIYAAGGFGAAAGISAMPSLHIATVVWMMIAVKVFKPRWLVPVTAASLLIFLLSISLGWHYAIDGIVGGLAALATYQAARWIYARIEAFQAPPLQTA